MELVKNNYLYWEFIRNLRNMVGVRQGFVKQHLITQEQQQNYMSKFNDCYYICLLGEQPCGYVGVIDDDIRVATHPDFQGRGVASFMINEIMKIHTNALAKVKVDNETSLRLFKSCGFTEKFFVLEKKNE
jgi:ribosomal protein S18 acetylase RimI-like enzyme